MSIPARVPNETLCESRPTLNLFSNRAGKGTTDLQVISGPAGYQLGDYLKKGLPLLDFSPGYRNGKPTASTYTLTWWFGRTVGW